MYSHYRHKRNVVSNPLLRGNTYMSQGTRPALVQIIGCRLFNIKLLFEPVLAYCYLDSLETNCSKIWQRRISIQENYFGNASCKLSAYMSRSQCHNPDLSPVYAGCNSLSGSTIGKNSYMYDVQVTFTIYGHFWCLRVLYSNKDYTF